MYLLYIKLRGWFTVIGWPGGDEAWRAQEPINAHSHLLTMLLGTSETVPVHQG